MSSRLRYVYLLRVLQTLSNGARKHRLASARAIHTPYMIYHHSLTSRSEEKSGKKQTIISPE
jgi:hypothetical protein